MEEISFAPDQFGQEAFVPDLQPGRELNITESDLIYPARGPRCCPAVNGIASDRIRDLARGCAGPEASSAVARKG